MLVRIELLSLLEGVGEQQESSPHSHLSQLLAILWEPQYVCDVQGSNCLDFSVMVNF